MHNPARSNRADRRWTLLFIGDRSKTVAFNHLKAVVIATVVVMILLAGLSGVLAYLYRDALRDIRSLRKKVDNLDQAMLSLRNEKDVLTARLVVAESRSGDETVPAKASSPPTPAAKPPTEAAPVSEATASLPQSVLNEKAVYHTVEAGESLYAISLRYNVSLDQLRRYNTIDQNDTIHPGDKLVIKPGSVHEAIPGAPEPERARQKPTPSKAAAEPQEADTAIQVDVEKFITFHEPGVNLFRVEYVIRNTGSKSRPITGRTVAILKKEGQNADNWLVLPSVALEDGKPTGSAGHSFSILNYRTIRFKINDRTDTDQFTNATVYVFTATGNLSLEKDFPVGPNSKPAAANSTATVD